MTTTFKKSMRLALLPALLATAMVQLHAETHSNAETMKNTTKTQAYGTADKMAGQTGMKKNAVQDTRYLRASQLVGKNIEGAANDNIGEINDMIIDVSTGEVRYVMFEYDPSVFTSGKVYAIPLNSLTLNADRDRLIYKGMTREQLDRVGVEKKDWKTAVQNTRYLDSVDTVYGVKRTNANTSTNLRRASDLLGKDVLSREGNDIGDIKELVIDMQTGKVRYAVLDFDTSWFSDDKFFAFPLTTFKTRADRSEVMLDVDRDRLKAMKNFDRSLWESGTNMNQVPVNTISMR